ncbi:hypothetical protein CAEBREN_18393 [Caenorhabditis brenneri]|uniref:SXP/RAL-2 family protein Ani s 5-like cation-binding domain-containing protein n=1 Tax=Caenorhabditis brenneri TaxID=135651 RepID=G0MVG5_CAEBE|nr:hypothetical protein CAEBREN_18393 [Caenorhabditis brenneri]
MMRLQLFVIPLLLSTISCQSFTFPLSPNQPYPQYNNVFESRYPYIPNQQMQVQQGSQQGFQMNQMNQMNGMGSMGQMNRFNQIPMQNTPIQQRFSFNPMTRIQVQPPMTDSSFQSSRVTSPVGLSEYQVDQRIPLPVPSPSESQSLSPTRIIPPFLESASASEQDKFYEIVQHPSWSGAEKNRRIEEFMKTMSDERQSMYSNYRRDVVSKEMEEKRQRVDRAVSTMTKEAVDEFQRVVRIMHDPSQTEPEKLKKIEEIYSKLPDSIRKEFDVKLKGFK